MVVNDAEQVRSLLGRINDAWLRRRPDELERTLKGCFHCDAVIKGPGFRQIGKGERECIKGYADFVRQAEIRECTLSEPTIDVFGETAVATYAWQMTYALGGQEYEESGHDLFVLTRTHGRWQAAWRMLLPDEKVDDSAQAGNDA